MKSLTIYNLLEFVYHLLDAIFNGNFVLNLVTVFLYRSHTPSHNALL